jgi:hypothetical protein
MQSVKIWGVFRAKPEKHPTNIFLYGNAPLKMVICNYPATSFFDIILPQICDML